MRYYIIYRTTNLLNGKRYIGKHAQPKGFGPHQFDCYLGSGKLLKLAIEKYGKEHFIRETLWFTSSEDRELLNQAEQGAIKRFDHEYNIASGGAGASAVDAKNRVGCFSKEARSKAGKAAVTTHKANGTNFFDPEIRAKAIAASTATHKANGTGFFDPEVRAKGLAAALASQKANSSAWYSSVVQSKNAAKAHTPEASLKREETKAKNNTCRGKNHYTHGKVLINREHLIKWVNCEELAAYEADGWARGRIKELRPNDLSHE